MVMAETTSAVAERVYEISTGAKRDCILTVVLDSLLLRQTLP